MNDDDFERAEREYEHRREEFFVICQTCFHRYTFDISKADYSRWQSGTKVQDAFPYLTAGQRQLLISQTCGTCFDKIFPADEDELAEEFEGIVNPVTFAEVIQKTAEFQLETDRILRETSRKFIGGRRLYKHKGRLNKFLANGQDVPMTPAGYADATLIGSQTAGDQDFHMPALDIDFPAHLEPSSTEGHFHLYLNKAITWEKYEKLLRALEEAEIIEPGYAEMSITRKQSFVRYPGVKKLPGEEGSG